MLKKGVRMGLHYQKDLLFSRCFLSFPWGDSKKIRKCLVKSCFLVKKTKRYFYYLMPKFEIEPFWSKGEFIVSTLSIVSCRK